jgi:hypothetical protein
VGEGNVCGGAGAVTTWPNGDTSTSKAPCGKICSSYHAEMSAIKMIVAEILNKTDIWNNLNPWPRSGRLQFNGSLAIKISKETRLQTVLLRRPLHYVKKMLLLSSTP